MLVAVDYSGGDYSKVRVFRAGAYHVKFDGEGYLSFCTPTGEQVAVPPGAHLSYRGGEAEEPPNADGTWRLCDLSRYELYVGETRLLRIGVRHYHWVQGADVAEVVL